MSIEATAVPDRRLYLVGQEQDIGDREKIPHDGVSTRIVSSSQDNENSPGRAGVSSILAAQAEYAAEKGDVPVITASEQRERFPSVVTLSSHVEVVFTLDADKRVSGVSYVSKIPEIPAAATRVFVADEPEVSAAPASVQVNKTPSPADVFGGGPKQPRHPDVAGGDADISHFGSGVRVAYRGGWQGSYVAAEYSGGDDRRGGQPRRRNGKRKR